MGNRIKTLYESVGRGFESLPSHQEKPEHVCVLVFLFVSTMEGARTGRRRIAPQAISPVGCCLARGFQHVGMSTVEAVKSKDFMAFLFFWQSLHTLQKSHELFASLAQRVFRCTKKRILREEHPRQLAAFLCVHLPDGFKDHFTCDFCCHRRFVFRGFLRLCTGHILRVEVGFDLLG